MRSEKGRQRGGGKEILDGGGALSLFRYHLSSFPPETPDTQATIHFFNTLGNRLAVIFLFVSSS